MPQFKFNTISRTDIESSLGGSQMLSAIDYDGPKNLLVTGCPGSGKTTVSIMRAQRLVNLNKRILVITFQDLLQNSLVNISSKELAPKIFKFHKWFFNATKQFVNAKNEVELLKDLNDFPVVDEIIIDEGQDFEHRVYRTLLAKCNRITVGADNAQKVHDKGLKSSEIKLEIQKKGEVSDIYLQYNYRNTFEIYDFARGFLPFNERANNDLAIDKIPKGKGGLPTVFQVPDHASRLAQLKILLSDAGDRNIAVLVYHIDEVDTYHQAITDLGFNCSKHHHKDHIGDDIENILVTTFKSAKGLEFQVVIMPNMETVGNADYKTEEHYYIACTRAKENLYLIVNSKDLPTAFKDIQKSSYHLKKTDKMAAPEKVIKKNVEDDFPF